LAPKVACKDDATCFRNVIFLGAGGLAKAFLSGDVEEVPMTRKTLGWIAGTLTVLLLALVLISGMQGRTADTEARLDYAPSKVAPLSEPVPQQTR
jgi:hypothetical protein